VNATTTYQLVDVSGGRVPEESDFAEFDIDMNEVESPDEAPEGEWHYWVGDGMTMSLEQSILCLTVGERRLPDEGDVSINVTVDKSVVDCQNCLEVLHS
jgi:hypothetical protein